MTEITEQTSKKIEQRSKKMLLELPIEYLNTFNEFKLEHGSDIRKHFYKSSQHEAFKYILREYLRLKGIEYKNLPVEIEKINDIEEIKHEKIKKSIDSLAKQYGMSENDLLTKALLFYHDFRKGKIKISSIDNTRGSDASNNAK